MTWEIWQLALLGLYAIVIGCALLRHLLVHLILRRTTFLTPHSPADHADKCPLVSILVPARDEARNIESCLRHLLLQDYPNYEIIVIDDRSRDETASIAQFVARRNARVRVVQINDLPAGWTGKNHALHVGQSHAGGEWLLFVDADATLHPACLSVVLRDAIDHAAGLASLLPRMEMCSFWERVIQPMAGTMLMSLFPLPRVNDRSRREGGFANGQFLMLRRDAYEAIGGHAAVRDKFCEDINLGRLVKQHQLGLRVTLAPELASVRMYTSLDQIVRGWSRIYYAAANARASVLAMMAVVFVLLSILPYIVLPVGLACVASGVGGSFAWTILACATIQEFLQAAVYVRSFRAGGTPLRLLMWRPLAIVALLLILLRTIRLCRTHRVVWRGTRYRSLSQKEAVAVEVNPPVAASA